MKVQPFPYQSVIEIRWFLATSHDKLYVVLLKKILRVHETFSVMKRQLSSPVLPDCILYGFGSLADFALFCKLVLYKSTLQTVAVRGFLQIPSCKRGYPCIWLTILILRVRLGLAPCCCHPSYRANKKKNGCLTTTTIFLVNLKSNTMKNTLQR
jgi:hypothetical protein